MKKLSKYKNHKQTAESVISTKRAYAFISSFKKASAIFLTAFSGFFLEKRSENAHKK